MDLLILLHSKVEGTITGAHFQSTGVYSVWIVKFKGKFNICLLRGWGRGKALQLKFWILNMEAGARV